MRPRSALRQLGQLGPLAAAATFLPPIGSIVLIGTITHSAAWLRGHGELGLALFVAAFAVCGGFALLPTYTPSLIGGWAFGVRLGLAATLAGFVAAAAIGLGLARRLSGDRLLTVLHEYPRGLAIHDAFVRSGFWAAFTVVTLVRLPPSSPFALANLALAGSRVGVVPYLAGTLVGIAPRAAAAVVVGAGLSELDFSAPAPNTPLLLGIAVTVGVALLLGWLAKRALRRLDSRSGRSAQR